MIRSRIAPADAVIWPSETVFLEAPAFPGTHAIKAGDQWIDVRYVDRDSSHTLVCFHSALTDHHRSLPVFSGQRASKLAGMNVISVADPSLALGDINLAWYLGNRRMGKLQPRLVPVIRHLLGSRRAVLFGSSGGGYAAVRFGKDFPGHSVLAVNPRLSLSRAPRVDRGAYLRECHGVTSRTPMLRVWSEYADADLAELYADGLPFDLYLVQNKDDAVFRKHQAEPFVAARGDDPRLHYSQPSYGAGHVPIPLELLVKVLREIQDQDALACGMSERGHIVQAVPAER